MNRRGFFGLLGGAAVAGPSVAKSAAEMGMADLAMPGVHLGGSYGDYSKQAVCTEKNSSERAAKYLERLLGKSDDQIARETRETYVSALDPDVASLRSMTLASKIRLQKRVQYERNRQREIENYRGILAGLWE